MQFFTAYGQADNSQTTIDRPRAKKVSLDGTDSNTPFLPTPPDSPVFAELTTAGPQQQQQHLVDKKPNLAKLNKQIQDGARAVPNLEMNTSITDFYMNTGR